MEFQHRAGDDRSRSPPPKTGAAAVASASSGSASKIPTVALGGGDSTGDHGMNRAVLPRPPPPPAAAAADSDELRRRQAAKDKIRERILWEEAEHWELEAEVRRELMEQLFPLMRPGLGPPTGARAEGSDATAALAGTAAAADSPSPILLEANLKANASASMPAKRKTTDVMAASAVLAVASTKKQKSAGFEGLACTVCGTKATSMRNMQEHLMGRGHKRKAAAALAHPKFSEAEQEKEEEAALSLPTSGYTPNKLTMLTNAGAMNEVLQMDGYLLCEVCNVRATDRITMKCHLEERKHILKAQKQCQAGKPSEVAAAAAAKKDLNGGLAGDDVANMDDTMATLEKKVHAPTVSITGGCSKAVVIHVDEVQHVVQLMDGVLFCDCCNVRASSELVMRSHLIGKKHKRKENKVTSASVGSRGKEAATALSEAKSDEAASVIPGMQEDAPFDSSISTAPIEAIKLAKIEDDSSIAEEEGAVSDIMSSMAQGENYTKTERNTVPSHEVKIQVEGKMCTMLQHSNGMYSCGPCCVHGCDKHDILQHLYTRAHWDRVPEKERPVLAVVKEVADA